MGFITFSLPLTDEKAIPANIIVSVVGTPVTEEI